MYEFLYKHSTINIPSNIIIAIIPFRDIVNRYGPTFNGFSGVRDGVALFEEFLPRLKSIPVTSQLWVIGKNIAELNLEIMFSNDLLPELLPFELPYRLSCDGVSSMLEELYLLSQSSQPQQPVGQLPGVFDPIPTRKIVIPNGSSSDQILGDPVPAV